MSKSKFCKCRGAEKLIEVFKGNTLPHGYVVTSDTLSRSGKLRVIGIERCGYCRFFR